jgi:hypothetical protein
MICFVMVVFPNAKVCMEHTSTFPTWSSTTNKAPLAPLGRRAAAKGLDDGPLVDGALALHVIDLLGPRGARSLLEIDVFPGGKFPCPQTSCRMRLRSAFVPGGTMGHGVSLTKPPDQCTSISVSAPWFQWVNIPKDEMLMKLTSQAATLLWRLKKNWPVPIFQIKAT